jgi:soluble lytic murein transglycosylase-like protein
MEIASEIGAVVRRMERIAQGPHFEPSELDQPILNRPVEFDAALTQAKSIAPSALGRTIGAAAAAAGVDPALVEAIVANESGFDANATSRVGARGLMQLMPQTAKSLGVSNAYDPQQNVRAGARYLRELLNHFGDVELAVAAYNAGPAAVERFHGVPPYAETRAYVRDVMTKYHELRSRSNVRVLKSATSR